MKVADLMEAGMTERDARNEALRRFGNLAHEMEESRAVRIARWMSDLPQDLSFASVYVPQATRLHRGRRAVLGAGHRRLRDHLRNRQRRHVPAASGRRSGAVDEHSEKPSHSGRSRRVSYHDRMVRIIGVVATAKARSYR
jgi:hypothetical protein